MAKTRTSASHRIAANVRAERARQKLTVAALAHRSGIAERTLYRLLNGDARWSAEDIEGVADALGMDWPALVATEGVAA